MAFLLLLGYIGILIWMLSPDHMHVLPRTKRGRAILLQGTAVVTAGYLLSISCQLAALVVLNSFGIPLTVSYFVYSAVYVAFWLLEAELFHRLQYKFSIQKAILKKKSLVQWLLITGLATGAVLVYNAIGGMAAKYVLVEQRPGLAMNILRLGSLLAQLRIPDIFLTACYLILYYRTMQTVIRTAEWG